MKKKIISYFKKNSGISIKPKELAKRLTIKDPEKYANLKQILFDLSKEGTLEKTGKRYKLNEDGGNEKVGKIEISKDGTFGFVLLKDKKKKDVFVPEKYLGTAFDGDIVEIAFLAKKQGKNREGQVVRILERSHKEIVGTLKKSNSFYFVLPENDVIHRDIYIHESNLNRARSGDKVVITDIEWNTNLLNPEGKVKEILGKSGSYDAELAAIAREFNFSHRFPVHVIKEAKDINAKIDNAEISKRLDLREEIIFTIDPPDAKDFDDAVSVDILENGNFRVGIHIADVSHFVPKGSSIFNEAYKRGTSVYLVGKVIPMLPEELSNKICSLVPNEDRLTYSVIVELSPRGGIVDYQIKKSVINSKRRFTYDEVQEILDNKKGELFEQINTLNKISKILKKKRTVKGSINFYTPEVKFELDDNGKPVGVKIRQEQESHNLIEELMLLANQIVAKTATKDKNKKQNPFVYRVHDLPDSEKIAEFSSFVKSLGYSFDPSQANNSKQFQILLDKVKGTEEEAVINEIAIRSMAKAIYDINNIGHYGLGFKHYTHFTSPIRRFPDLIIHSLIFNYLEDSESENYSLRELEEISEHSSIQERNAVNAERLSIKIKQIELLKDHLGEEFHAVVSGVTHFGIFVELSENLAEGLITLRDLEDDYYIFDEKNYSLKGRRSGRRIRLGDRILVKLLRVNEEKREIDFALLDE